MRLRRRYVLGAALLSVAETLGHAAEPDADQKGVSAEIEKLGGRVEFDASGSATSQHYCRTQKRPAVARKINHNHAIGYRSGVRDVGNVICWAGTLLATSSAIVMGNRSPRAVLVSIFHMLKQRGYDPITTITAALTYHLTGGDLPHFQSSDFIRLKCYT